MMIRFFSSGTGGGAAPVEYLIADIVYAYDENRDIIRDAVGQAMTITRQPKPVVVSGDPERTLHLIDASSHKWSYTSGVIAFEYDDKPSDAQQLEVIEKFERLAFAGLENDQFDCLWVKHTHEDRAELHFCSPRIELTTGRAMNIAPPKSELKFDTCADYFNRKYCWADPKDPNRAQAAKSVRERPGRAKTRDELHEQLFDLIVDDVIFNRSTMVEALRDLGWDTPRLSKNFITALDPDTGERYRLKGEIFHETWTSEAQLERAHEAENGSGRRPSSRLRGYSNDELFRRYQAACSGREKYNRKRYRSIDRKHEPEAPSGTQTERDLGRRDHPGDRDDRSGEAGLDQAGRSHDTRSDADRRTLQRNDGASSGLNLLLADIRPDQLVTNADQPELRDGEGLGRSGSGSAAPARQRNRSMPAAIRVRERLLKITQGESIDADAARERIAKLRRRTDDHLRTVSDSIKKIGEITERMRKPLIEDQQEHVARLGALRAGFGAFATGFTDLLERLFERARSANAHKPNDAEQPRIVEREVERAEPIRAPTQPSLKP